MHYASLKPLFDNQAGQDALVRCAVSHVAQDHNLKRGRFITEADKDRMRAEMKAYEIKIPW